MLDDNETSVRFVGDGTTRTFPLVTESGASIYFTEYSHIKGVEIDANGVETNVVFSDNYEISGKPSSGSLYRIDGALPDGYVLMIWREQPFEQATDFGTGGKFRAEDHESVNDRIVQMLQELRTDVGRSIKLPRHAKIQDTEVPLIDGYAPVIEIDDDGNASVQGAAPGSGGGGGDGLQASEFMEAVLQADNSAEAQEALGLSPGPEVAGGYAIAKAHGGARWRAIWSTDQTRILVYGDTVGLGIDPAGDNWGPFTIGWDAATNGNIVKMYAGINYLLIQSDLATGNLFHVGYTDNGQGGNAATSGVVLKPTRIAKFVTDAVKIANVTTEANVDNTEKFWFAITTAGALYSCGYAGAQQVMGYNSTTNLSTPRKMTLSDGTTPLADIAEVFASTAYAPIWARTTTNKAYRWGAGTDGAHGNNSTSALTWPTVLETSVGSGVAREDVAEIAVSGGSSDTLHAASWFLTTTGKVFVAGANNYGIGNGATLADTDQTTFTAATGGIDSETVSKIRAGGGSRPICAAITTDGELWLVGRNGQNLLANGSTGDLNAFTKHSAMPSGYDGYVTDARIAGAHKSTVDYACLYIEATISGKTYIAGVGYDNYYAPGAGLSGVTVSAHTCATVLNLPAGIEEWQSVGDAIYYGLEIRTNMGEVWYVGANDQGQAGHMPGNLHSAVTLQPSNRVAGQGNGVAVATAAAETATAAVATAAASATAAAASATSASTSATAAATSATAAAASDTAAATSATEAAASADEAEASAATAASAAAASGDILFYDTYADADAALSGLSEGQVVEIFADEEVDGHNTRYRVESGVLVFKLDLSTPVGGIIVVDTVAELKTIEPIAGRTVRTLGNFTAGDGGGGVWRYSNDSDVTDDVICVPYNGDLSAEVTTSVARTSIASWTASAAIAFGTFSATPDAGGSVITDLYLHGHNAWAQTFQPMLNHATGAFQDAATQFNASCSSAGATNVTIKYKTIGNSRRWVREESGGNVWRVAWAGSSRLTGDNGGDWFKWALTHCKRLGKGMIDGDNIQIILGGMVVCPTDVQWRRIKIKYRDDSQLRSYRVTIDYTDPEWYTGNSNTWIRPEHLGSTPGNWFYEDVEVDGNIDGNRDPIDSPGLFTTDPLALNGTLQNAPVWGGIGFSNQGGIGVGEGSVVELNRVYVHNVGSGNFFGHGNIYWKVGKVRAGASVKGHMFYTCHMEAETIEINEYCWTSAFKQSHLVCGKLLVRDLIDHPQASSHGLLSLDKIIEHDGADYNIDPTSHRYNQNGILIGSVFVDWDRGDGINGQLIAGNGPHVHISNVHIRGSKAATDPGTFTLYTEQGNGNTQSIHTGWNFKSVSFECRSPVANKQQFRVPLGAGTLGATPYNGAGQVCPHVGSVNVTVREGCYGMGTVSSGELATAIAIGTTRSDPQWLKTNRQSLSNASYETDATGAGGVTGILRLADVVDADAGVRHISMKSISARMQGYPVSTGAGNSGLIQSWRYFMPEKFAVDWEDIKCSSATPSLDNWEPFWATAQRVRNFHWLDDALGYVVKSEDSGDYIYTHSGASVSYIDVPTKLLNVSRPDGSFELEPLDAFTQALLDGHRISWRNRGNTADIDHWSSYPGLNIRSGTYKWTASGSGTDEYYLEIFAGGNPLLPGTVRSVLQDGVYLKFGTASGSSAGGALGSLVAGSAGYGDNDSLGYNTVYVRLSDGTDPDTKADGALRAIIPSADNRAPIARINLRSGATIAAADRVNIRWRAQVTR